MAGFYITTLMCMWSVYLFTLTNVLLAVPAYRWLRIGRPTEELGRKLLAAGTWATGAQQE